MLRFFSVSLYFLSFLPLWISIVFLDVLSIIENKTSCATEYISIICILLATTLSAAVIIHEFHRQGKEGAREGILKSVKEEKTITAEYLLSYILPLFAFDFTVWSQVVLFLIFFMTLGFLFLRHNYYCVNIVLELAGYRFYQCSVQGHGEKEFQKLIISRRPLNSLKGNQIIVAMLNNDYGLDVSDTKK